MVPVTVKRGGPGVPLIRRATAGAKPLTEQPGLTRKIPSGLRNFRFSLIGAMPFSDTKDLSAFKGWVGETDFDAVIDAVSTYATLEVGKFHISLSLEGLDFQIGLSNADARSDRFAVWLGMRIPATSDSREITHCEVVAHIYKRGDGSLVLIPYSIRSDDQLHAHLLKHAHPITQSTD